MNKKTHEAPFKITEKGSLGLLALGDIGIRAWRKIKKEAKQKSNNEEEK